MSGLTQTVVAYHAIGLNGISFAPLSKRLPTEWRWTAVELARSVHDLDEFVDAATSDALEIAQDERIHLVGHSFGGVIAAQVAARLQDQCASLALLATPPIGDKIYLDRGEAVLRDDIGATIRDTLDRWFSDIPPPHWTPVIDQTKTTLQLQDRQSIAAMWRALGTFESFEPLPRLSPTLCVSAEDDRSTPPEKMRVIEEALGASGTAVTFKTIPRGGHLFPMTEPEDAAILLHQFWLGASRDGAP